MEDNIELIELYYTYNKLFTEKQKKVFEMYYISDLSLREVALNLNISYQGVRDTINTCKKYLYDYEEKLKLKYILSEMKKRGIDLNV